ncbi:MAG: glycogen debranching enzyme GlgX, partial [Gammaproteobacteria bacterium]|nr:glycogen debranching enzyme GlgX [Gammaproteobacteria bacterium]
GDEMGRTQGGNNNAYCQDNELNWIDWNLKPDDRQLIEFTRRIIQILQRHPVFRRRSFFQGRQIRGSEIKDIVWLKPDGNEMTDEEWQQSFARCLGLLLAGAGLNEYDDRGQPISDANFLLLINAHHDEIGFVLPAYHPGKLWKTELDTSHEAGLARDGTFEGTHTYPLQGRSFVLMREMDPGTPT